MSLVSRSFERGQRVRCVLVAGLLAVAIAAGVVLLLHPDSGVGALPSANEHLDDKAATIADLVLFAALVLASLTVSRSAQHRRARRIRSSR